MKVLRITPHFYHPTNITKAWKVHLDPIGGMQTQIYRLAASLSAKGIQQTVLTIGMENAPKKWNLDENVEVQAANIPIIPIRSRIRGTVGLNFYWGLGVILWMLRYFFTHVLTGRNEYDHVHVHCSGVVAPLIVGIFAKLLIRRPLIYSIHCCRLSTYEPMSKFDTFLHKYVIKIEKFVIFRANGVVVLTERTKQLLLDTYPRLKADKVHVIPDMISFEAFEQGATPKRMEELYQKYEIPREKRLITFVGRIAHEKGWKYLIKAIQLLDQPDVHFLICGDGNERLALEKMVDELGLRQQVTITGFISNEMVASGIAISEVMVVPSVHEELGSIILEVASMKKPVVCSAVGGLTEIVKDGLRGCSVPAKSPEMIAKKLEFLLRYPEKGMEMGENLYQYIKEHYEADAVAVGHLALLEACSKSNHHFTGSYTKNEGGH